MNWYLEALKKYAVFSGRARRKEYWMFSLFYVIIYFGLAIAEQSFGFVSELGVGMISILYGLLHILPSLAVGVRRLHDTGRSGWWMLIAFVPIVGGIALLVFVLQDSESGHNQYGPNPKGAFA